MVHKTAMSLCQYVCLLGGGGLHEGLGIVLHRGAM